MPKTTSTTTKKTPMGKAKSLKRWKKEAISEEKTSKYSSNLIAVPTGSLF
jgi:hypothetical protein